MKKSRIFKIFQTMILIIFLKQNYKIIENKLVAILYLYKQIIHKWSIYILTK